MKKSGLGEDKWGEFFDEFDVIKMNLSDVLC